MTAVTSNRRQEQEAVLAGLKAKVREMFPGAVTLCLETSDQNRGYGFVLNDILDDGDETVLPDDERARYQVDDDLWPFLCDLDWNGVVGEDWHGYAEVDLTVC